jgi:prepilin-type N-terminal cleavage/methylation domain-containing protein
MARHAGYTLVELLFVAAVFATLSGIGMPLLLAGRDSARAVAAARYVAARLQLARLEAVRRSACVGFRVDTSTGGMPFGLYVDGNGDGVRAADIEAGADRALGSVERLDEQFPGVVFGVDAEVLPVDSGEPLDPGDPIRIGRTVVLSFSPAGGASGGSLYVLGRSRQQYVVRVLGVTGRVRVMQFDFRARQWVPR